MAKYVHSFSVKGELDAEELEIKEETKETIETYSLQDILAQFDGKVVSIAIKEEVAAEPAESTYQ